VCDAWADRCLWGTDWTPTPSSTTSRPSRPSSRLTA
jgi:hypothetical protein